MFKMMSESDNAQGVAARSDGTTSNIEDGCNSNVVSKRRQTTPPRSAAKVSATGIHLSGESRGGATWVKFEEEGDDDVTTTEEAATIQPSSIEVVATKTLQGRQQHQQQKAVQKDSQCRSSVKTTNGINQMMETSNTCEVRIEPPVLCSSPPHSPLNTETHGIHTDRSSCLGAIGNNRLRALDAQPTTSNATGARNDTFVNGDVICTVLPSNKSCAWVTRAKFRPNIVPEEIMDTNLTITVEDYILALQILINDVRFTLYNVLYKRILLFWMLLGFVILLFLLFSGTKGLALFGGGIFWLIVNATGIFVCMWIKFKLYLMLERCVAHVNQVLIKHDILVGLDDRGKISCHKVHLIFIYFNTEQCLMHLCTMLEEQEKADAANLAVENPVVRARMDVGLEDNIIITRGSVTERIVKKEKTAEKLLLRYSQRWVKEFVRKRLDLSVPIHPDGLSEPGPPTPPRHCSMARCPCQFIEEHLRFKPLTTCSWSELCC